MHREYAIDPEQLADPKNLTSLFQAFIDNPSRLVSDCPRNWAREVSSAINYLDPAEFGPVKRKQFKVLLRRILPNVIRGRAPGLWSRERSWLSNALMEHKKSPFDALLSSGEVHDNATGSVHSFESLLFEPPDFWLEGGQQHIRRVAADIVAHVQPLLRLSQKVILVDPYFRFTEPTWSNYRPMLEALFEIDEQLNFGKGIRRLEIHTSDRYAGTAVYLRTHVMPLMPEGMIVECKVWPEAEMHDRFILTNVGGVFLGQGLAEFTLGKQETVLVGVLERETYRGELAKLQCEPVERTVVEKRSGKTA